MSKHKPRHLSNENKLRRAVTQVAIAATDRLEQGQAVRPMELAFARALDRKLVREPRFAWRAA